LHRSAPTRYFRCGEGRADAGPTLPDVGDDECALPHPVEVSLTRDPALRTHEVEYDIAVLGTKVKRRWPHVSLTTPLADAVGVDHERVRLWASVATAARV
jgi:hypothetical protein